MTANLMESLDSMDCSTVARYSWEVLINLNVGSANFSENDNKAENLIKTSARVSDRSRTMSNRFLLEARGH
jgi:uncharacterized Fe-S cluster-containing protein